MPSSRSLFQQWTFAVFLLCSPAPHYGKPVGSLTNRMKRTVTHAQLMHDKGRALQDFKRHMWLQELLHGVHTAEERDFPTQSGFSSSISIMSSSSSIAGSSLQPKPTGSTKTYPMGFPPPEEEGTNLPQETNKLHTYKVQTMKMVSKKKKKGRSGKRRESDKRKRRVRSLGLPGSESSPCLEQGPHARLRGALH